MRYNKVLYDKVLEPWQRVALRELNDFAYPIQINNEIFWRWYLITEEEAQKLIQETQKNLQQDVKQEIKQEKEIIREVKQEITEPKIGIKPEQQISAQVKIEQPIINENIIKEIKQELEQKKLIEEKIGVKKQIIRKIKKDSREFYLILNNYLNKKKIEKLQEEIIKKNKEFELIVNIQSNLGLVKFLLVAKDKKKVSDADLSLAHNKAQLKKLPLIFLSNGELIKSAKIYLKDNYLVFEKI